MNSALKRQYVAGAPPMTNEVKIEMAKWCPSTSIQGGYMTEKSTLYFGLREEWDNYLMYAEHAKDRYGMILVWREI